MTDPVKDMGLEQIEELLAKTTPGKWILRIDRDGGDPKFFVTRKLGVDVPPKFYVAFLPNFNDEKQELADGEFIALSKQIVQSLIRRVRAYRELAILRHTPGRLIFVADTSKGVTEQDIDAEAERLLDGKEEKAK
jgi:hypothetical protein